MKDDDLIWTGDRFVKRHTLPASKPGRQLTKEQKKSRAKYSEWFMKKEQKKADRLKKWYGN